MNNILSIKSLAFFSVFLFVFSLSLYLKTAPILNNNFPFTMDQARDMLDIRNIVVGKKPTLIGPTTSINGVFLGPFYYYLNLPAFVIGGGDPAYLVYWNIFCYMAAGILIFLYFYKESKNLGLIASSIYLMSPALFYSSRYFWSANPMPVFTVFFFLMLFYFLKNPSKKRAFFLGIISGLSMQIEAAFGTFFFPVALFIAIVRRKGFLNCLFLGTGFFVTLLPQVFFELRHHFVMTKTFFAEVGGTSQILGEKLTYIESINNHYASFVEFLNGNFELSGQITLFLMVAALIFLIYRMFRKTIHPASREIFLNCLIFICLYFVFYSFYPHPLKGWYLLALRIPYLLFISAFFYEITNYKKIYLNLLMIIFLGYSFYLTSISQLKFVPQNINDHSGDKSNLRNEMEAIDWVYQKADGKGFKIYNYIPSVYDYPYQYLFWWYGTKKYGYQPETITYKDGVPEYIPNNEFYWNKKRLAGNDPLVFLLYEKDENKERLFAWLGDFVNICRFDKSNFTWDTTVEIGKICPAKI